ncbi:GMC oxidoreductase [Colletotrichum graminicola]|uniref:GMC oxidoreductase n=1 Tax=Colletotrichum graminicola (strain M1.001 / M2 / FGSC 10212) TaxID=645133 RepID=E3QKV6_COLGM|nr:GMC oxidoreductase [Colletotrichum graminicola M1.001]EFQ31494.1 GMC oxidoreductase [Colletotrichum graminicola M1.001]WDK19804.1 GMC oxidoreductase [Colletotrichum graminicola]
MASFKHWLTLLLVGTACDVSAKSYDYVIVGGGTSGSALAARLSLGLPNAQILLLEAGPGAPDELQINVPGLRGSLLGTNYDWNFTTVRQGGLGGRRIDVNRGKVLGGSSALNYLCYDRAAAVEYDTWADLGSKGWTWEAMIDAMTRSENFTGTDRDTRGRAGPIRNTYNRVIYDVVARWLPAAQELSLPINEQGYMHGSPIGFMFQGANVDDRTYTRSYSANSYLPLAGPNLEVRTGTRVAKINLESDYSQIQRATGVTLDDGTIIDAAAEVILSAGSIQSPGLLELSGIGRPEVLEAAGVAPVIALDGVGENYQDHVRTSNIYRLKDAVDSFDAFIYDSAGANATGELKKWTDGGPSLYDYTTVAYGFLDWGQAGGATRDVMGALARAEFGNSTNPVDRKKLAFLADPSVPDFELLVEANWVGLAGYPGSGKYLTIIAAVMHPFARGSVHINPADPEGAPVIDPGYLASEHDVRALAEAARFARKIANTGAMRDAWEVEAEPGPAVQTVDDFRKFAADNALSFYHPIGTCALLPRVEGGVVGADLRVYGTTNLRVVDMSVVPVILSGHIQTAAYGIAEMAAGKIIADAAC